MIKKLNSNSLHHQLLPIHDKRTRLFVNRIIIRIVDNNNIHKPNTIIILVRRRSPRWGRRLG